MTVSRQVRRAAERANRFWFNVYGKQLEKGSRPTSMVYRSPPKGVGLEEYKEAFERGRKVGQ